MLNWDDESPLFTQIFPLNIKGAAGSFATLVNWSGSWACSYTFNFLMSWSTYGKKLDYISIKADSSIRWSWWFNNHCRIIHAFCCSECTCSCVCDQGSAWNQRENPGADTSRNKLYIEQSRNFIFHLKTSCNLWKLIVLLQKPWMV